VGAVLGERELALGLALLLVVEQVVDGVRGAFGEDPCQQGDARERTEPVEPAAEGARRRHGRASYWSARATARRSAASAASQAMVTASGSWSATALPGAAAPDLRERRAGQAMARP